MLYDSSWMVDVVASMQVLAKYKPKQPSVAKDIAAPIQEHFLLLRGRESSS